MDWNVYSLIKQPAYQALLCLLLTPIFIFILKPKSADKAWAVAMYVFALFLIINAGFLWFDSSPWRYFFYSLGFALGYILCVAVMMPQILKVLKLKSSQESAMAFLIIIYQPFVLLLIMLVKWIVTK